MKITILPSGFLLKSSLQTQKSTFTAKFNPILSLEVIFFALIHCWGRATASRLVQTNLASIFNIMTALHVGKWPEFLAGFVPSSHIFHI